MPRGPSRTYPSISVIDASLLPQSIRDSNAGRPMNRVLLAQAVGRSPASSDFRELISASGRYGFTKGNYQSESIELTPLGEQLTKTRSEGEKLEALQAGFRKIPLFAQLLNHYNNNKLPEAGFIKNTLERDPFSVPAEWSEEAAKVFFESGKAVGFVRQVGASYYVVLQAGPPAAEVSAVPAQAAEVPVVTPHGSGAATEALPDPQKVHDEGVSQAQPPQPAARPQFFIAHGKNKSPVEQLKKILNELGIPYVIAEEEANTGRPISQKVKDLMTSCTGGMFVFTADEELKDIAGSTILRPRENVVYELGAASYLYDRRIVILKERGVTFPSDFRDLGYIEFERDQLSAKSMELIRELIALGAIKLVPSS